jgi:hypothetical protein
VETSLTRARLRWVMIIAAVLILAYLLAGALVTTKSVGRSDFTSFYGAATLLREGRGAGIYNPLLQQSEHSALVAPDRIGNLPFVDPPVAAAILIPLTFVPFVLAYHLWAMLEFFVLLLAVLITVRSAPWPARTPQRWKCAAAFAALAGAGTYGVVIQAQWTPVVALGLALAYRQWRADKLASGAFLLVFAAGVTKPHLALVLGAFMLGWRDRRLLTGALAGVGFALLANLLVAGPDGLTGFVSLALSSQSQWAPATYSSFISIPAILLGNSAAAQVVAGVALIVACAVGWRLGCVVRRQRYRLEAALAAAALLSFLAAPHALLHDTTMLAPALVWMLAWTASRFASDPMERPSPVAIGIAWSAVTAAGLASVAINAAIGLGWIVAATLLAVAVPASLIALTSGRSASDKLTPSIAASNAT